MKRRRRNLEVFSLSFLDVIVCGFGAVILLLVLVKVGEPAALERARQDLGGMVARLQQELFEIRGEAMTLNRELVTRQEQLARDRESSARLQGDLSRIRGEFAASQQLSEVKGIVEGRLVAAQQKLTDEMKRLQDQPQEDRPPVDRMVGGIPVDSEYIIFVIDTSGSMQRTWSLVVEKMNQTLDIYPQVKGIQVLSDMGQYMFSRYAGKWIPDTPARRKAILDRLRSWRVFSNSSPVEGLARAIRTFAAPDKRVSVYVFGDEFTGASIDEVLRAVRALNKVDAQGRHRVRIHAIGFPVMFSVPGVSPTTGIRFATLMRALCHENSGTFVALNAIR